MLAACAEDAGEDREPKNVARRSQETGLPIKLP